MSCLLLLCVLLASGLLAVEAKLSSSVLASLGLSPTAPPAPTSLPTATPPPTTPAQRRCSILESATNEAAKGQWKKKKADQNNKAFPCTCAPVDVDGGNEFYNISNCGLYNSEQGSFHAHTITGGQSFYPTFMGHGCACQMKELQKRGYSSKSSVPLPVDFTLPAEDYEWVPNECVLPQWNTEAFCRLLGGRRILIVGDSTMQQTAASLYSMLLYNNASSECLGGIFFEMSDFLVTTPMRAEAPTLSTGLRNIALWIF